MASKGQKFKKYTIELKEEILEKYYKGEAGPKSLSKEYDVPFKTIQTWIDKINNPHRYLSVGRKKGRPKSSEIDWKERYEILKKYQTFLKAQRERK